MTENQFILSDQIEGYPHPKLTKTLFGHETQEKEFIDCYKSGKLHHGWLITGARGIGKATLAWRLARFILTQPIKSCYENSLVGETSKQNNTELDDKPTASMASPMIGKPPASPEKFLTNDKGLPKLPKSAKLITEPMSTKSAAKSGKAKLMFESPPVS